MHPQLRNPAIFSKEFRELNPLPDSCALRGDSYMKWEYRCYTGSLRWARHTFLRQAAAQTLQTRMVSEALDTNSVVCAWTLSRQYAYEGLTQLVFDLIYDCSPLTFGVDVQQISHRLYMGSSPNTTFSRSTNTCPRTLPIYILNEHPLKLRAYVDITGLVPVASTFLVTNSNFCRSSTMEKRLHRYTHTSNAKMVEILSLRGHKDPNVRNLCCTIIESFPV